MDSNDVKKLWLLLGELFPRQKQIETENKLLAWTMTLAPYQYDLVRDAAISHARVNSYYPSIAEILDRLPEKEKKVSAEWTELIRLGSCKDGSDDLGETSKAAREHGVSWEQAKWERELA